MRSLCKYLVLTGIFFFTWNNVNSSAEEVALLETLNVEELAGGIKVNLMTNKHSN